MKSAMTTKEEMRIRKDPGGPQCPSMQGAAQGTLAEEGTEEQTPSVPRVSHEAPSPSHVGTNGADEGGTVSATIVPMYEMAHRVQVACPRSPN